MNDESNQRINTSDDWRSFIDDVQRLPILNNDWVGNFLKGDQSQADIWEEGDEVNIRVAMPGVKKEDIDIKVVGNEVRITGECEDKGGTPNQKGRVYYVRRMRQKFEERFRLPLEVDVNQADARFKDGVLQLTLPKLESSKATHITISE